MKKDLAVFIDLDKTIVACSTEKVFGYYLFRKGFLGFKKFFNIAINYAKYDIHIIKNFSEVKCRIINEITKDKDIGFYENIFEQFFKENLKSQIYPEIYGLIEEHKAKGYKVYIISAALSIIVKPFADELDVDGYFATELEQKNGKYSGNIKGLIHYGENKAFKILKFANANYVDLTKSFAYGDYFEDHHMMDVVGNPIAVNPDKKLKEMAVRKKWDIKWLKL